mmetsp:Transcript_3165/g.4608  ORF Transcript_3165/g.4608 Transcript_3165/m.4608 type:complete len:141 (+) Transcript_3165:80-502(+)
MKFRHTKPKNYKVQVSQESADKHPSHSNKEECIGGETTLNGSQHLNRKNILSRLFSTSQTSSVKPQANLVGDLVGLADENGTENHQSVETITTSNEQKENYQKNKVKSKDDVCDFKWNDPIQAIRKNLPPDPLLHVSYLF